MGGNRLLIPSPVAFVGLVSRFLSDLDVFSDDFIFYLLFSTCLLLSSSRGAPPLPLPSHQHQVFASLTMLIAVSCDSVTSLSP